MPLKILVMTINFYKENNKWWADLPKWVEEGNDKSDLEMVAGSDAWLDVISLGDNQIKLEIDTNEIDNFTTKLFYVGDAPTHVEGTYLVYPNNHYIWLCHVTKWLFGNYPQAIYYKIVE
jgi:hypothetical protein